MIHKTCWCRRGVGHLSKESGILAKLVTWYLIHLIGYLSSTLQCIVAPILRAEPDDSSVVSPPCLADFVGTYKGSDGAVNPVEILQKLAKINPKYTGRMQEDACETLNVLLENYMNEEIGSRDGKETRANTFIGRTFGTFLTHERMSPSRLI